MDGTLVILCPKEKARATLQAWREETGEPLSETGTRNVISQQMDTRVWGWEVTITISYIQIMLSLLLTAQTYKGKSQNHSLAIGPWTRHLALQSLSFLICKLGRITSTWMGPGALKDRRCIKQSAPCPTHGKCSMIVRSYSSPRKVASVGNDVNDIPREMVASW